jgi:type II secretory pathway pseudopilin PulG
MRTGHSVLDLSVALALIGVGVSALLPAARRQLDRSAVLSAREAAVAQVARARREARLSGGATLQLRREGGRIWIETAGEAGDTLALEARFGVRLEPGGASASVAFDALGIGRLANRTLLFVRGEARTTVTISAYGRVRRQ